MRDLVHDQHEIAHLFSRYGGHVEKVANSGSDNRKDSGLAQLLM